MQSPQEWVGNDLMLSRVVCRKCVIEWCQEVDVGYQVLWEYVMVDECEMWRCPEAKEPDKRSSYVGKTSEPPRGCTKVFEHAVAAGQSKK
jgi:hypothetical protein